MPGPGAMHQPWHRDFATPLATTRGRRLNSLAFNITTVDVTPDLAPFEIAPGTQFDDGSEFGVYSRLDLYTAAGKAAALAASRGGTSATR